MRLFLSQAFLKVVAIVVVVVEIESTVSHWATRKTVVVCQVYVNLIAECSLSPLSVPPFLCGD